MPESFEHIVETTLRKHRMLEPEDHLLVAVSGGPDSTALLHALHRLSARWPFRLTVAHLNHGLRDQEADHDALFVQALAASLSLACIIEQADVRAYCRDHHCSVETGARATRYAFLARVAEETGAHRIATGHTADDQAETVLMRLLRGSGPAGLSGIRPVRDGRIIRPLLYVSREQVMAYLAARRLTARRDTTNDDPEMLRNRIRGHLLPLLQNRYNPEIRAALSHLTEVMRAESEYLDKQVEWVYDAAVSGSGQGFLRIDAVAWNGIALALQRRLVRRMAAATGANPEQFTYHQIERVREIIASGHTGQLLSLPGDLTVERRRDTAVIRRGKPAAYRLPVEVPGATLIPEIGCRLITRLVAPEDIPDDHAPDCACFDAEAAGKSLVVRSRQTGDRLAPPGMTGTKSLKALFNEWDIPRLERERIPVLCSDAGILWVVGRRRCRWADVSAQTRQALLVRLE